DASNGTVTNNQVSNSANQGIVINYSDNIMVTSNRVNTANLWHQAFAGISILNSRAITVMGNITTNNGWGVQALNVSDSTFTNNSSFNNMRGDLYWDGKGSQSF